MSTTAGALQQAHKVSGLNRTRIERLPAINFMPYDGRPFDITPNPYVTLPAIGDSVLVLTGKVPPGNNGVIKRIANVFIGNGFTDGSGDLIWQILLNVDLNLAAPYYNAISASLGSVSVPSEIDGIRIDENITFGLLVTNVALVPSGQTLGGRLGGYYYPIASEMKKSSF